MNWKKTRNSQLEQLPLASFGEVIYAIGDIHGCFELLIDLLNRISTDFQESRKQYPLLTSLKIVFLGDYIDRGPDSYKVIEFLSTFNPRGVEVVFLKGNHEQVLLDVLEDPTKIPDWLFYGGDATLQSYSLGLNFDLVDSSPLELHAALSENIPLSHKNFLINLKAFYHSPPLFFAHAGVNPKRSLEKQNEKDLLWIRERFLNDKKKLSSVIVHGHTPQEEPSWDGRRIGLDTGAYYTNKLVSAKIYDNNVEYIST